MAFFPRRKVTTLAWPPRGGRDSSENRASFQGPRFIRKANCFQQMSPTLLQGWTQKVLTGWGVGSQNLFSDNNLLRLSLGSVAVPFPPSPTGQSPGKSGGASMGPSFPPGDPQHRRQGGIRSCELQNSRPGNPYLTKLHPNTPVFRAFRRVIQTPYTTQGVPVVAQQKRISLASMRSQVQSLASCSGLRIRALP